MASLGSGTRCVEVPDRLQDTDRKGACLQPYDSEPLFNFNACVSDLVCTNYPISVYHLDATPIFATYVETLSLNLPVEETSRLQLMLTTAAANYSKMLRTICDLPDCIYMCQDIRRTGYGSDVEFES